MLSAFTNSLKIPELRQKIFFTLALLFIARVGANIPLPGVDPAPIKEFFELRESTRSESEGNDILGFYNMFTGGALLNGALFALGIMPYISASIIMQLMGAVFPTLARLQQEGEPGRQKNFTVYSLSYDFHMSGSRWVISCCSSRQSRKSNSRVQSSRDWSRWQSSWSYRNR